MEPSLALIEAFVHVVEQRSFGKAAQALQLTPSAVSRQIKALEDALGVQLLRRTTRAMSLTEPGTVFFAECQAALDQIRHARETARRAIREPRGTLKISVPVSFGRRYVVPHVAAFLARFPEIQIDLTSTDRFVDVIADGLSMAIRIGRLPDSRLITRKLLGNRRLLVASPAWVAAYGPIDEPDDLKPLDCLALTINRDGEPWRIVGSGGERSIRPQGRARADSGDAIRRLAVDGAGVAFLSEVNVAAAIRAGRLVQVLPRWTGRETGVYAVFPPPRPVNPSVDAFAKFLSSRWEEERASIDAANDESGSR
ncbi:LysR family transcriptional regulator [Burkholderia aenigmatica]|uniref:LysR family transcriptional regulator n=1 Tax=Burkholderia cepacia complex TaxID=87882 RepID=UPI00158F22BE|nr:MULTISPECIES: LysR family transcriptional regulator [Burkholderia cepacia complex]UKD16773.1 LysR family transcriptional regulator [Burkholderia aenigmatica]